MKFVQRRAAGRVCGQLRIKDPLPLLSVASICHATVTGLSRCAGVPCTVRLVGRFVSKTGAVTRALRRPPRLIRRSAICNAVVTDP